MATPVRDSKPGLIRRIARPFAELWLGLNDAMSPEMKEIRDRALVAEIRTHGEGRVVVRKAAAITAAVLGFDALPSIGSILAGKHTWGWLFSRETLPHWAIVGVVCYVTVAYLIGITSQRLLRKYPDEFRSDEH